MLTDPQAITISGVPHSLAKISSGNESALYRNADTTVVLRVSHQHNKGRTRTMVRVDVSKIAADPLTAENARIGTGVYLVIDKPDTGFSASELLAIYAGLDGLLTANDNNVAVRLIQGES